jgi:hypothetical protein
MTKEKKNIKKNIIREQKKSRKGFSARNLLPNIRIPNVVSGKVKTMLDGSFLTRDSFLKQAPFFFYIVFIAFVYIAMNFYADKTLLGIEKTKEDIKELRFEFVTTSQELTQITQASFLKKELESSGLKRSTVPPEKIIIKKDIEE